MSSERRTSWLWRPRFSVRTLIVIVTLVCCYAACWLPTKTTGVDDVRDRAGQAAQIGEVLPISPLLVRTDEMFFETTPIGSSLSIKFRSKRRYYVWLFGHVVQLPYEQDSQADVNQLWRQLADDL